MAPSSIPTSAAVSKWRATAHDRELSPDEMRAYGRAVCAAIRAAQARDLQRPGPNPFGRNRDAWAAYEAAMVETRAAREAARLAAEQAKADPVLATIAEPNPTEIASPAKPRPPRKQKSPRKMIWIRTRAGMARIEAPAF